MSKITQSARDENCQIRIPGICTHDRTTVVFCHANGISIGKGVGMKSDEILGAYGCLMCHLVVDGQVPIPSNLRDSLTRDEVELCFWRGHARTLLLLVEKGLVVVRQGVAQQ